MEIQRSHTELRDCSLKEMPDVHFTGSVDNAAVEDYPEVSLTFAFVPGSAAWYFKSGRSHGETHTARSADHSNIVLNYPIDVHYDASSAEGWPFFVCELWDKSDQGVRNFIGCGAAWLPQSGIRNTIDVCLWRPSSCDFGALSEMLLPTCPDLKLLRELTVSPYLRSHIDTESVGTVRITVNTITSGFEYFGVQM